MAKPRAQRGRLSRLRSVPRRRHDPGGMASAKLLIGGAGAAALTVRVTRSLYSRWNVLPAAERARIEPVAERAKQSALDLRGAVDRELAGAEARAAGPRWRRPWWSPRPGIPELDEDEVVRLREDLARELARLADADIKASRSTPEPGTAPG